MTELFDAKQTDTDHQEAAHEHHGGSFRTYWIIALVLGAITIVEVLLAEQLPALGFTGGQVAGIMLLLSIFKAVLVAAFYMHLKYEKRILTGIFLIPFFLVSLLMLALFANP
jgi:cytochrome c oxidase subunit IV